MGVISPFPIFLYIVREIKSIPRDKFFGSWGGELEIRSLSYNIFLND